MIGRIKAHASPNSLIFLHNVKTMHIQSLRRLLTVPVALLERTQHGGLSSRSGFAVGVVRVSEACVALDSAHLMQMGLMPISLPTVTGLDVAGICRAANHVGGDLFQYFTSDDKISIASADVTGHRFICFTMIEINGKSSEAASCGNPYPRHFHDGEVSELKVDDYPQSVREDTQYNTIEAPLHERDYLVRYSDGIPETTNPIRRDVRWG
jgi:hypothetical protein